MAAKKAPEPNERGMVVLKHPKTGLVQQFVPESVDTWLDSGWVPANDSDVKSAAEEGLIDAPPTLKES